MQFEGKSHFPSSSNIPPNTQYLRWFSSHLETIKRCISRAKTTHIWLISNICDYSEFDFHWKPPPWESTQIHCWASGNQKFGDTFLIPVEEFKSQMSGLKELEFFQYINWHDSPAVSRYDWPVVNSPEEISSTYAWINGSLTSHKEISFEEPSLWKKHVLIAFNIGAQVLLLPRACKTQISVQPSDYHHILCVNDPKIVNKPLDVVYLSNGELNGHRNWLHLQQFAPNAKKIEGITGRIKAYHACAEASETDWFFAVFAKCFVNEEFDWNWQPDRLQGKKHWIFHARNPVNGLEYGHMAVAALNKQLVLETTESGLDFIMTGRHDVMPILSCDAVFNIDELTTWRTAFREVAKLSQQPDEISQSRLHTWKTIAEGDYAKWALDGAHDALEFVNSGGDLKLLFEWEFLRDYFFKKYKI